MNTRHSYPSPSAWIFNSLRDVVVNTVSSPDNPVINAKLPGLDDGDAQKLIEGALFNEKIIKTYPWVILWIMLVISGIHWSEKIIRWRRRTLRSVGDRYSYNSLDDGFEPSKTIREDVIEHSSIGSSGSSTFGSNTSSINVDAGDESMPLLSSRAKNLSNRFTIISRIKAFLIYQPRPIPYLNKVLPSNGSSLFILSFLALNLFYTFYNIPFATIEASILGDRAGLVFGVNLPLLYMLGAKNQPLKVLTGVSYESLNIIHRRLGEMLMFEALIHASGMFVMWYTLLEPYRDRLVYRLCAKSLVAEANISIFSDNETILVAFNLPKNPGTIFSRHLGHSISSGWRATDHIFLTIPSLGSTNALQAHPFTIASPAPLPSSKSSKLSLLIRARDGFSADLLRAARVKKSLTCRLDGPYGSSHARELLEDSDLAILVAGGSGIAVTWPIAHHLLNISREDPESASSSIRKQRIVLLWIIHRSSHLSWIDAQERQELENQGVEIIIPGATREFGRPDLEGMMEGIVRVRGCEKESARRIGVVVSGPNGMNRIVNNQCAEFVKEGQNLKITVEKFGW
ncbi:hypothetical protein NHQ30_008270 [Ciborinia camelliae]|nr:hypothetical protein NHQ30_008270 [Ciborinia camelliae]